MVRPVLFYHRRYRSMWIAFTAALLFVLLSYIPLRLAIAHHRTPHPDTILTLGGGVERELFAAQFAQHHPDLDIWVSTGIPTDQARKIFRTAQISSDRVHIDRRAIDTVTNFTSLVHDFEGQGIHHVYLITSDFHMRRASTIAFFVLGSRGIAYTPIPISSERNQESIVRVARDAGRSLLWLSTGRTAARFHPTLRASRQSSWPSVTP